MNKKKLEVQWKTHKDQGVIPDGNTNFKYTYLIRMDVSSDELNILNLSSVGSIFVSLGGLYSSLSIIAIISLSAYTTNRYHKRIAQELQQTHAVLFEGKDLKQIEQEFKDTLSVQNQCNIHFKIEVLDEKQNELESDFNEKYGVLEKKL